MTPLELSTKAQDVIRKVEKLLALANDPNNNEHQASAGLEAVKGVGAVLMDRVSGRRAGRWPLHVARSRPAAAKAQELLVAYNLDMDTVTSAGATREDKMLKGGLYQWQRDLWKACAALNFCHYRSKKGLAKGSKYEHQIIGRKENVIGTRVVAEYLQQTIERLAQAEAKDRGLNVFVREMIAFREGMSARLTERLESLRRERLRAEREQQERDQASARKNGTTSNALVLTTYIDEEECGNQDFMWNLEPGTTSRRRREAEADYQKRMEQHAQWERDFPEQAAEAKARRAKEDADWLKKEERNAKRRTGNHRYRKATAAEERAGLGTYRDGYEKANDVNLSSQVDQTTTKGRLKK